MVENNVLINNEIYGDGFVDTLDANCSLYDDFCVDKYQTERFIDMYEHIMEAKAEYGDEEKVKWRETTLPVWQEKVLASGYSSFTFDW